MRALHGNASGPSEADVMRVYFCDHFEVVLPPKHRFPMHKYGLLRERLLAEGLVGEADLIPAEAAPLEDIHAVHDAEYVQGFLSGELDQKVIQRIGFPWSEAMVMRSLGSVGSTLGAAEAALEDGLSGSLAGGTHHAYRDFGSGYCVFNDLAIAARRLLDRGACLDLRRGRAPGRRHRINFRGRRARVHLLHARGQELPIP